MIHREPGADMRMAAARLHEMFTALVEAGFSELQAMQAVAEVLKSAIQAPPGGEQK